MKKLYLLITMLLVSALLASCTAFDDSQQPENSALPTTSGYIEATTVPEEEETESNGVLSSFSATDIDGAQVDEDIFSDYKLTMVNIWATFCSPCIDEMPELAEINNEYADMGVQVVGIVFDVTNSDGTISDNQLETAREIIAETGASYTHLLPSDDLADAILNSVFAVPETIFVDSQGNQVGDSYTGSRSLEEWVAIINDLLEEVE